MSSASRPRSRRGAFRSASRSRTRPRSRSTRRWNIRTFSFTAVARRQNLRLSDSRFFGFICHHLERDDPDDHTLDRTNVNVSSSRRRGSNTSAARTVGGVIDLGASAEKGFERSQVPTHTARGPDDLDFGQQDGRGHLRIRKAVSS